MATFTIERFLQQGDAVSGGSSSGLSYGNVANAYGPSDGLYSGYSASVGDGVSFRMMTWYNKIPADATITNVTFSWGNDESTGITATCRLFHAPSGVHLIPGTTATFRGAGGATVPVTGYTTKQFNECDPLLALSGTSSRRRLDYFRVQVTYTTPEPTGPVVKRFDGSTWVTATTVKRFDGTNWVNATVTKL